MPDRTETTVAALIGGGALAINEEMAAGLMALPVGGDPVADVTCGVSAQAITVQSGERFAVQRGVAVVPVRGILTANSAFLERFLGWTTYAGLESTCAALADDPSVNAVILDVDSPGGMVLGVQGAAAAIKALAAIKPVYAIAAPMAASAGYWLASQAREISVAPGGVVGSIGVMMMRVEPVQAGASGNQGFRFLSSHAQNKVPDATTDAGRAEIIRDLDELESDFLDAVAEGRGIDRSALPARLSTTDDASGGGAVYLPRRALEIGLVDRIETVADFYARVFEAHAEAPRGKSAAAPVQKTATAGAQAQAKAALARASI